MKAFTEQPKHIREGVELPAEELDPFSSNSTSSSITNFVSPPSQPGPSPAGGGVVVWVAQTPLIQPLPPNPLGECKGIPRPAVRPDLSRVSWVSSQMDLPIKPH